MRNVVWVALAVLLAGCGGDAPEPGTGADPEAPVSLGASDQGVTAVEIVLGAHTDLSGPIA